MKTTLPKLLGINSELSTYDVPVFEKNLEKGHWGSANMDRTIYINKNIYYRKTPFSPIKKISRNSIKEGAHNLPWEASIYKKTKKYAT